MSLRRAITYPFVPRSSSFLLPGQFWALPLSDGSFGCGRVIEAAAPQGIGSRVLFLAGVLDWHANVPPTYETIAGATCLNQGSAHIKAITETGGSILGHRPLELDNIEPWEFRGAEFYKNSVIYRGLHPIRSQQPADGYLPVRSTWGYLFALEVAEHRFIKAKK